MEDVKFGRTYGGDALHDVAPDRTVLLNSKTSNAPDLVAHPHEDSFVKYVFDTINPIQLFQRSCILNIHRYH